MVGAALCEPRSADFVAGEALGAPRSAHSHSHSHSLTPTHTHSLPLTLTHPQSLSLTLSLTLTFTVTVIFTFTLTFALALTFSPSHSLTHRHSQTLTFTLTFSLSLSHSQDIPLQVLDAAGQCPKSKSLLTWCYSHMPQICALDLGPLREGKICWNFCVAAKPEPCLQTNIQQYLHNLKP